MVIDFEHHYTAYEVWKRRGGKPGEIVRMFASDGREIRPLDDACHDIHLHLRTMDASGVDMAVLTATADNLEEARLNNEAIAGMAKKYPERFIGFATALPMGGKPAMDELERSINELKLKGVIIPPQSEGAHLDSREMWPFYEKISELGVPMFVHVSMAAGGFEACNADYDLNRTLVREFDLMLATARICLGGVLEDFPDLKFIIAHFGGGISSIKERLDRYVSYWGEKFWNNTPHISAPYGERFNEYFSRIYFNTAGREIGVDTMKCALTNISPRRLLFGTDYPPNFVDDPEGIKKYIEEIRGLDLGKSSIEAILSTNGMELLGL